MARREAVHAVQVAVASLPEDYREVIRLRYFEGKTLSDTAAAMARSPDAVRALTDRAKKQMRDALGRFAPTF